MPEDVVAKALAKSSAPRSRPGKPPEVAEKIVEGKLNKWYEEHVLLDQPFVKDDSLSVSDLINAAVGSLGEKISVRRFTKFALGEN